MEPANWAPAHCAALRTYADKKLSYSDIADAINLRFGTNYSRSAVLGRARRMGLCGASPPGAAAPARLASTVGAMSATLTPAEQRTPRLVRIPDFAREAAPLRCAEVDPRRIGLIDLSRGDCRYPYGGDADGEPITFCGHPRRKGSSYCTPHFHLTRDPDPETEHPADRTRPGLAVAV